MKKSDLIIYGCLALAVAGVVWWQSRANSASQAVAVKMPQLTAAQTEGRKLFEASCATCHGANAGGTGQGPPLIHIYYEPNHHPDMAFYSAIAIGVRQHHWSFGNMPPVEGVSQDDATKIIDFLRAVQRENGIR